MTGPLPSCRRSRWQRFRFRLRKLYRRVVHIEDTPHRVAWGFAIGMFIGWLPIVGAQMLISAITCWLLRANPFASIPPVWISNPLTMVPMYWAMNHVGALFAGRSISWAEINLLWQEIQERSVIDATIYLFTSFWEVFLAMLVGGSLIGIVWAVPSYFLLRRVVIAYQRLVQKRRQHWLPRPATHESGRVNQTP